MPSSISENIGRLWLESTHTAPTRSLQLAFERSQEEYQQLTDFSIIISILKNNPCTVPPEQVAQIESISKFVRTEKAKAVSINNDKRRNKYSQTIDPFRAILPKYLSEKRTGLHQYASANDCSLDLISGWIDRRPGQSKIGNFLHRFGRFSDAAEAGDGRRPGQSEAPGRIWQNIGGAVPLLGKS